MDPEIREVIQAFDMLKAFDAGYQFAKKRQADLSQQALDKCQAYLASLQDVPNETK